MLVLWHPATASLFCLCRHSWCGGNTEHGLRVQYIGTLRQLCCVGNGWDSLVMLLPHLRHLSGSDALGKGYGVVNPASVFRRSQDSQPGPVATCSHCCSCAVLLYHPLAHRMRQTLLLYIHVWFLGSTLLQSTRGRALSHSPLARLADDSRLGECDVGYACEKYQRFPIWV